MNLEEAVQICPTPAALVARDTRRADEVTKALKELDSKSTNVAFDQGDLFVEVEREAHYATAGYESADDYYKSLNIDISKREIQYRAKISKSMAQLGLSRAEYAPARLSKLKIITELNVAGEIVDSATEVAYPLAPIIKKLVAAAPTMKLSEVRAEVDVLLGKGSDDPDELTWLNLPIRRDAKEVVEQAIELARALSGDTIDVASGELKDISTATALERISADFIASPSNQLEQLGQAGDFSDSIEDGDSHEDALESEE